MDEFARIRHWTEGRQSPELLKKLGVIQGIGDDTAVVEAPATIPAVCKQGDAEGKAPGRSAGHPLQWLMTVDTMVESVHFNEATMEDEDIGWKALAANVSDIAAMGGVPLHALVSISVPASWAPERISRIYEGLYQCAGHYHVAIIGGDTTSAPNELVLSVTLTGVVEQGKAISRSGVRPGDAIFITGMPGMSAAGLHWLSALAEQRQERPIAIESAKQAEVYHLVRAHRRPQPSVQAARMLAGRGTVTALNDISDGVASEAWELARASGVKLVFEREQLPLSESLTAYARRAGVKPEDWFFYGGEDYALLGAIAADDAPAAKEELRAAGLPFFIVGAAEEGEPDVELRAGAGNGNGITSGRRITKLAARGYNHFA